MACKKKRATTPRVMLHTSLCCKDVKNFVSFFSFCTHVLIHAGRSEECTRVAWTQRGVRGNAVTLLNACVAPIINHFWRSHVLLVACNYFLFFQDYFSWFLHLIRAFLIFLLLFYFFAVINLIWSSLPEEIKHTPHESSDFLHIFPRVQQCNCGSCVRMAACWSNFNPDT